MKDYPEYLIVDMVDPSHPRHQTVAFEKAHPAGWAVARTVLVADDNPIIREALCRVLR
jgi:hypothetical protein